jgi:cytochrome c oxidase subunit I
LIFARGMISAGLEGMPRRTFLAQSSYEVESWWLGGLLTGIGGTLMFVGIMLFFVVIVMTLLIGERGAEPRDVPVAETLTAPATTGWELNLDRVGFWVVMAIILILIAYGPYFLTYTPNFVSPGYRFF